MIFCLVRFATSDPTAERIGKSALMFLLLQAWLWKLNKYVYYEIWKEK